jgi:hypothetical protein
MDEAWAAMSSGSKPSTVQESGGSSHSSTKGKVVAKAPSM